MDRITAVLIVRNEVARLPACLASLRGVADRAVVLDTGSDDGTVAMLERLAADPAQEPPVSWSRRPFDDFSRTRTAAIGMVETPFFLWIDADERLSPALAREIIDLQQRNHLDRHDLWRLPRENRVLGRVMRARSLVGQTVARLARTGRVRLSGEPVHEGLVPLDPECVPGLLTAPLEHEVLTSVRSYLAKIDHYTTLEAQAGHSRYGVLQPLHFAITGPTVFWREYVWRGCWRDGRAGLVWASLSAWSAIRRSWKVLRSPR